jgi:4-alpha-glucanotransferase
MKIVGDLPIFVAFDSADVWANPDAFDLDADGRPRHVAGVPPDYFSATGQLWGNPLYRWDVMQQHHFQWWTDRLKRTFEQVDVVRIDHFRGFEAYWQIPAGETTAQHGRWQAGPGQAFFDAVRSALGDAPIIAEDLGVITPEVDALRTNNNLPGMRVLQFAFAGNAADPYLPHNFDRNTVVYTGTHDNDTTRGWFDSAPPEEQDAVRRYLGRDGDNVAHDLIRVALASVADTAVVPLQDALNLGSEARMNTPGSTHGNWSWRLMWEDIPEWLAAFLLDMNQRYARVPPDGSRDTPYRQSTLD